MIHFVRWLKAEPRRQAALARHLKISSASITQWIYRNSIPAKRVRAVHEFTGIEPAVLNPEVFGW